MSNTIAEEQNIAEEIQGIQGSDDRATISFEWRRLKNMAYTVADAPYFLYRHHLWKTSIEELKEVAMSLRINDPRLSLSSPKYFHEEFTELILKKQYPYPIVPMKKLALNEYRKTLRDIHRSLYLVNARRRIALNGKLDKHLDLAIAHLFNNIIGREYALEQNEEDTPTKDWRMFVFLVHLALDNLTYVNELIVVDSHQFNHIDINQRSVTMPKEEEIAYEIQRMQLVADNITTHGHTLDDIHRSLCLIEARRVVATDGYKKSELYHFCYLIEQILGYLKDGFKTPDYWASYLHELLEKYAQQLREIFKES